MRLSKTLALLVAVLSSCSAVAGDTVVPLSPDLVESWRQVLVGLQPSAARPTGAFVWEGELPATVNASPADRFASTRDSASLLEMLGTTPVAVTDVAIWLLADTGTTAVPLLLRLSAREWAIHEAAKMLESALGQPIPHRSAADIPTLLSVTTEPASAKPQQPPPVLEPVELRGAQK
jgi:hypothetical protein